MRCSYYKCNGELFSGCFQVCLCWIDYKSARSGDSSLNVMLLSGTAEADTRDEHDVYGCSRLLFTSPKIQPYKHKTIQVYSRYYNK